MRKTTNTVTLFGKLYSHSLEHKVSQKGVNYIGGSIDLQTDDAGLNIVTVNYVYIAPTYPAKNGKPERPNPNYAILDKIINAGKSVITDGPSEAWLLKLTPSLAVNDFPNREGEMVAAQRLEGGFVSIVPALPTEAARNQFVADTILYSARLVEADADRGINEDYLELSGFFFNFANAILPATFILRHPDGIKYFESLDLSKANPTFIELRGSIVSQTIVSRTVSPSAFGAPLVKESTRTSKEWLIESCANEPYEMGEDCSQYGITPAEFKEALSNREIHLAEVKAQNEAYQASKKVAAPASPTMRAAAGDFNF